MDFGHLFSSSDIVFVFCRPSVKPRASRGSKPAAWRTIWRKIKRDKGKLRIYDISSSSLHFTYDPFTYSLNFDQGSMWDDADDLGRSFSARFAVPTRVIQDKNDDVVLMV